MRVVGAVIWSAVALVAAHASANPFCDEEYKESVCPIYCTGVLAGQCCKHVGTSATILSVPLPTHSRALAARVDQYRWCTGARITLAPYSVQCSGEAYCGGFAGLYEIGLGALEDAKGASVYDAYMTQAPDVPLLAGYVGDLAPLIKKTPALKWGDVMSQVRKQNAVGAKQVAMPFDFDSLGFLLRDDLVAAYPGPEPRTFEELAAFAEYFYDKDLNGDGVPDFGLCSLNGAAVAGPQALLMQIAAAKLQYLGSEQGLFLFRQRTSTRAPDDVDARAGRPRRAHGDVLRLVDARLLRHADAGARFITRVLVGLALLRPRGADHQRAPRGAGVEAVRCRAPRVGADAGRPHLPLRCLVHMSPPS